MSRAFPSFLALLFAAAGAASGLAQDKPDPGPPARTPGTAIGVVDFSKVLEAYPRAIQERKRLDELFQQRQAALDIDERKAQEIRQARDVFQKDTNDWRFKDLELRLAAQALEGKRQIFSEELRQQQEGFYVAMLEDMQRAVAIVAKERNVALVLRVHGDLLDAKTATKARVFEARVVWYAADEVDLTPAVIKLLQVPLPELPKATQDASGSPPRGDRSTTGEPHGTEPHGTQQGGSK